MDRLASAVALHKSPDRKENIREVLEFIGRDITKAVKSKRNILIKPNFVSAHHPLCATHVEAVEALLDFILPKAEGKITIAETPTLGTTKEAFENYGYQRLTNKYPIELSDLQEGGLSEPMKFGGGKVPEITLRLYKMILDSDFLISIGPAKTHDTVIVTLSLKNIIQAVNSLEGRSKLHNGYYNINYYLAEIGKVTHPDLAIIDGTVGMQGNGPIDGDPTESNFAVASLDFLAADTVATTIMGYDPREIGYIQFAKEFGLGENDLAKIDVLGSSVEECETYFRPHSGYKRQRSWMGYE